MERSISGVKYKDDTPNTIFASAELRATPDDIQILDMENYSKNGERIPFNPIEKEFTQEFRKSEKSLSRVWNVERLHQKPMFCEDTGYALLLPLPEDGNETGLDWLSYKDPLYHKVVCDIVDEVAKKFGTDSKEFEEASYLLVDYTFVFPYGPTLRHDGSYLFKGWDDKRLEIFGHLWESTLIRNFFANRERMDEFFPKVNATKGLGFFNTWPDGRKVSKFDDGLYFVPSSLATDEPNNIYRYNCAPVKFSYLDSGIVRTNLEKLLKDPDSYEVAKSYVDHIFEMAASVHTEAYRNNNPKIPKWSGDSARDGLGRFTIEDKLFSFEIEPYMFFSAERDSSKFCSEMYKRNPERKLCVNTRRPIYPGPNSVFGVSFTFLFNLMFHQLENGFYGFLSLHPAILDNLNKEIEKHIEMGWHVLIISFDRSNSEQFITDNYDKVKKIFGNKLAKLLSTLTKSIVPSKFGGRFVEGLISGAPPTTITNGSVGAYEYSNLSYELYRKFSDQYDYRSFSSRLIEFWSSPRPMGCFTWTERIEQFPTLGTDDQNLILFYKDANVFDVCQKFASEYKEGRFLKMEVSDHVTSFGIRVDHEGARADSNLGMSKLFLMEKTKNGDACALKMYSRLLLLSKFYDIIQGVFDKYKLGRLSSYEKGARNFFKNLSKFGWPIDDFWVQESPKDKIIMGEALKQFNIDPTKDVIKYSEDQMKPLYDLFAEYLK